MEGHCHFFWLEVPLKIPESPDVDVFNDERGRDLLQDAEQALRIARGHISESEAEDVEIVEGTIQKIGALLK